MRVVAGDDMEVAVAHAVRRPPHEDLVSPRLQHLDVLDDHRLVELVQDRGRRSHRFPPRASAPAILPERALRWEGRPRGGFALKLRGWMKNVRGRARTWPCSGATSPSSGGFWSLADRPDRRVRSRRCRARHPLRHHVIAPSARVLPRDRNPARTNRRCVADPAPLWPSQAHRVSEGRRALGGSRPIFNPPL